MNILRISTLLSILLFRRFKVTLKISKKILIEYHIGRHCRAYSRPCNIIKIMLEVYCVFVQNLQYKLNSAINILNSSRLIMDIFKVI